MGRVALGGESVGEHHPTDLCAILFTVLIICSSPSLLFALTRAEKRSRDGAQSLLQLQSESSEQEALPPLLHPHSGTAQQQLWAMRALKVVQE